MLARSAGYHQGFNFGFNIAEAVNFAVTKWLDVGPKTKRCRCVNWTVSLNLNTFYKNLGLKLKDYVDEDTQESLNEE